MPGLGKYEEKEKGERGYKMGIPTLLKMVEEEKKHFLERNAAGPIADPHGIYDDSKHNIAARETEGTVAEQKARREDPPALGFTSMDADSYIRGQILRKKKKKYC